MVRYEGEKIMCTYHYALFTILRDILHTHPENLFLDYFPYINEYNEAIFDNRAAQLNLLSLNLTTTIHQQNNILVKLLISSMTG